MNTDRNVARIVGVLFIVGTVAGILSAVVTAPVLSGEDFLTKISTNTNQLVTGMFFVLIMGLALTMVPVLMFPIFRKYNEALALGSVIFRGAFEGILYIAIATIWLLLIVVSQKYLKVGTPDTLYWQNLGTFLLKAVESINTMLKIVFSLGALMIYYMYYQSELVPRWLSIWGLIAALVYLIQGFFATFAMNFDILLIPLALQEMVLAVWLIVKGFNQPAISSESANAV